MTGPHDHTPRTLQPVGSGPRPHAPRTGRRAWVSAQPQTPQTQGRGAPPRSPSCRPTAHKASSHKRAVRLVRGPHAHTPHTHSLWVADPVRTPQGRAVGRGRAQPRMPHTQATGAPPGAPVPPHSAQSQLAGARAVGLVAGFHAHIPPHPQPVGSGPRPHAPRTGVRAWVSAQPRTPHTQARDAPTGCPRASPTARKASSQERALWGW